MNVAFAARMTVVVALLAVSPARADVIVLESGTIHAGEVQKQSHREVVFRTQVDGVWQDLTFKLSEVRDIYEDPGDQASKANMPADDARSAARPKEVPGARKPRVVAPAGTPRLMVIPLHGQVGGLVEGTVSRTFDAQLLGHFLDRASSDGVDTVVLDIRSPGGFLTEMEAICELILSRQGELRIVAYVNEALSAAAIIAMSCREIVISPHARMGAAVMVHGSPDGLTAVDAKLASPHHARQRQYMAESGHPYEVLSAMTIQETQLWWSASDGFTNDELVARDGRGFRLVDGETTVLTLIADDAVKWGLAVAAVREHRELPAALGLGSDVVIVDLSDDVENYNREIDRRLGVVHQQFGAYFQSLGQLFEDLGRLADAMERRDTGEVQSRTDQQVGDLQRLVRRTQAAARSIRSQDRRLLGRRTEVPETLMSQLDRDTDDLAVVARLLREKDMGSTRRCRKMVQDILEAWRGLMSF